MERIANNIANKIALELSLDNDKKEVIAYGAFSLLQMTISIILVIIFGRIFNDIIGALIISFTASTLRKYSGGIHASSPGICTFLGILVSVGQASLIYLLIGSWDSLNLVIILGVLIFLLSYYLIYKLAPVDNVKKPIKKEEKRKRMKKGSILILNVYLIIVTFLIMLYAINSDRKLLIYSTCLYGGLLWQVFTLTDLGHLIIGKLDTFLSHIYFLKRR